MRLRSKCADLEFVMDAKIGQTVAGMMAAAAMAGVTVPSTVVLIGKDTNVKALKAAGEYCDKLGKHLVFQRNAESGVYGWSPRQSNLTFL
jgi:hypothetical protein